MDPASLARIQLALKVLASCYKLNTSVAPTKADIENLKSCFGSNPESLSIDQVASAVIRQELQNQKRKTATPPAPNPLGQ